MCVSRGHGPFSRGVAVTACCGDARGLPSLSQVSQAVCLNGMCVCVCGFVFVLFLHLSAWFCYTGMCACVCKIETCPRPVRACLTSVLWLAIAGNPSTSQTKKTIKQRFLKLLPCCKPTAAPSISESKCSFTLYTSLLPPVCPAPFKSAQRSMHIAAESAS